METLKYLHKKGICHRDVKPDNILYDSEKKKIVLIDFEICKQKAEKEFQVEMWSNTSLIYYKAPEMFEGAYNEQIDIWAVGVIAYLLYYGSLPFYSKFEKDLRDSIKEKEPDFEKSEEISENTVNFIKACLEKCPLKRFNAVDALKSDYFE